MNHSSFFVLAMLVFYGKSNAFAIKDSEGNSSSLRGRAAVDPQRKLQAKCGCSSCTDDVLETYAGAYKCGDRIDWLMSARGYSENDACTSVAGEEFPVECAGCNPDACADEEEPEEPPYDEAYECGCTSCTEEVWNTLAGPYSCGSRITWLQEQDVATLESYGITNGPFDKAAACASVSTEFPEICTCNPAICNEDEPTPQTSTPTSNPTDAPTSDPTSAPTSAPTASPTKMPTEFPTDTPTSGPTEAPPTDSPTESPIDSIDEPVSSGNCGCDACTDEVFDTYAGAYKCGDRINWVNQNIESDRDKACIFVAEEFPNICGVCHSGTCGEDSPPAPEPAPVGDIDWDGDDLTLTHYWDCSGQSCDAGTLAPWDYSKYRAPVGYQPQDPDDFGGPSEYGEKLWVTAAIMNIDQGENDECCGSYESGGCGKCILISNPDSLQPDWTVMAMKKNTCGNCRENPHADINVPGFDVLQYSLANICGEPGTGLSKEESTVLGEWYKDYDNIADAGAARCSQLPAQFQKGCRLFSEWGWTGGTTSRARYKVVECPDQFKAHIGSLFDENGVIENPDLIDDSPPPPPPEPSNGGTVLAMSYNTEYTGYRDGRVPNFGQKIVEVGPDVVGLQECQDPNALARSSPGYSVLSGTGPQNYILYDNDRVEVLDSGWMDVPRDCYAQRTVTWGKFRIRSTGSEFWFFNTHLPHNGCAAQSRDTHASIARSLVDKRNELGAGNTPTIVVGDCNPFASSGSSQGSFESNLDERGISLAYVGTGQYGGYGYLDKIFASDGDWTIVSAGDRGTGSSDHPAIAAELRLN